MAPAAAARVAILRSNSMRSRLSLLCLALAIVAAYACRASSSGSVTFGAAGPWNENYGIMNRRGIELAVEEFNARPDRRGPEVRVIFRDDQADAMRAAAVAREFVDSSDVVAVIGHLNSEPMAAAARIYDGNLPAVSTTASSPDLSGISPWAFRVISSDSMNGLQIARFAMRTGRRRAAILYENNSYGRGLTDSFQRGFRGDIVSVDPIAEGADQSFEPFVSFYKERAPDVVFVAGTGASGLAFLREARRQGLTSDLIGADGWSVLAADTALSEGVLVGAPFGADIAAPGARRFAEAFQKRYGISPDGNAALAYDATRLLATAVERVGANRRRIRDYLRTLGTRGGFDGVTGSISFSAEGDPIGKTMVMTRIRHGSLVVENMR